MRWSVVDFALSKVVVPVYFALAALLLSPMPNLLEEAAGGLAVVGLQSTYYSGYSAYDTSGGISEVTGSWTVPVVTCHGTKEVVFIWVGLDDGGKKYLEQAGTGATCAPGNLTPSYYTWYEMFPDLSVNVPDLTIKPGDRIKTTVSAAADRFTFHIENLSTSRDFTTSATRVSAARLGALWIVEAPWTNTSSSAEIYDLATFATFTIDAGQATVDGSVRLIDALTWDRRVRWTMRTPEAETKAAVSDVAGDGMSFQITWHHR